MSGLNPSNAFSKFDPSKILTFAKMYLDDPTTQEIEALLGDIESFRHTIRDDDKYANLNGISDLTRVMVETGTHGSCPSVYRAVKLALLLTIATTTVERCFSKLKFVKTDLRNRMGPEFFNNVMVCEVEKDFLREMERFQAIKKRTNLLVNVLLPPLIPNIGRFTKTVAIKNQFLNVIKIMTIFLLE
ncbi:uncharacterized protein LOC110943153 [Helianthus annuus]|uniref:uncharacterized protein LOC110943153 n=1 Tax=Helianthus annuus TaxID=4232 RepID=UPI000B8FBEDE|nr:uncharacterized protein LOC110943153 [Helianthus annuus]